MSPSRSITGVLIRTVRPSSSTKVTGLISLVGQPYQLPVLVALAGSELTAWSMRKKSGSAPSSFVVAMLLPHSMWCALRRHPGGSSAVGMCDVCTKADVQV